jgi:hypothetical protein
MAVSSGRAPATGADAEPLAVGVLAQDAESMNAAVKTISKFFMIMPPKTCFLSLFHVY